MKQEGWSIEELENLIPYERDIYVDLLIADIEAEKDAASRS